ncbi:type II toxin-antitoxin system antitoxin SocA domain-containing protein [Maricaulis sp.]|uniref:Panacea domain-containing protein n=1 Tax=Maricaulis sp. TaxID=1486257 RepID=UPI00262E821F|nr:type II toxin-antitoxin system antitoxin SocA domain-containing protein [Maricaulis sp.]
MHTRLNFSVAASQFAEIDRAGIFMSFGSTQIARHLLELAKLEGRSLTPLELIKLTYLAHGWSLGLRDEPLVADSAEAWQYGPVFPDLYHALKKYRASSVTEVPAAPIEELLDGELSDDDKDLIGSVFEAYKGLSGVQLSALTHQPNTPWDQAWKIPGRNTTIKDEAIKAHFKELAGS